MKNLAVALCLLATGAAAQEVEQVTVYGGSLNGVWKVTRPAWLQITMFNGTKWGPLRDAFCRIDHGPDGYTTHCFGPGRGNGGTLEVDSKHFHLAWGSMMARIVLDGAVESAARFTGHFALKLAGIPIEDPDLTEGTKLEIKADAPDPGGKTQLLRTILEGATPPHDAKLDEELAAVHAMTLGRIEAIAWLDEQHTAEGPGKLSPYQLTAYAVEFEQGERLCWLHQDDDGKLAAFQCS
jgi:hypothetical protein